MQAFSFDCGLRNLAAAVVRVQPDFAFPLEFKTYLNEDETADEFKERALRYFLFRGWVLENAALIDVSESLGREKRVKAVLKLSLMNKAQAIHAVLEKLETDWFSESAPDVLAVEIQHGANAEMRAVSLSIPIFYMRSMADTEMIGVVGGQKLKLCDAAGVSERDGLAYLRYVKDQRKANRKSKSKAGIKAAAASKSGLVNSSLIKYLGGSAVADAPPVVVVSESSDSESEPEEIAETAAASKRPFNPRGQHWRTKASKKTSGGLSAKERYDDNKGRSMKASQVLIDSWQGTKAMLADATLLALIRDPNIADAMLQAVWVLWTKLAPRAPTRSRKRKVTASTTPKTAKSKTK